MAKFNTGKSAPDYSKYTFNKSQTYQITLGKMARLSNEKIALYANPAFSEIQMDEIRTGLENVLSIDKVKLYAQIKPDGNPLYSYYQMNVLRKRLEEKASEEEISLLTSLNRFGNPIFSGDQMEYLSRYFELKIPQNIIAICAKSDTDGHSLFNAQEMNKIVDFFTKANDEQVKQIFECINSNLPLEAFGAIMSSDINHKCMRIYKSFIFDNKIDKNFIKKLIKSNPTYDELKHLKICMKYAEMFNCTLHLECNKNFNIDETIDALAFDICSKDKNLSSEKFDIINKYIKNKIDPELLKDFLDNKDNSYIIDLDETLDESFELNSDLIDDKNR
jgi:hypothetical protein